MAFSNIADQNLGRILQISFSDGVRTQISEDFRDWEQIKRDRVGDPNGREHRFYFLSSFGPSAIQYRNPNFTANFPQAQQVSTSEHSAVFKEVDATVEIEYNLWNRARKSPAKYAEPLALEIMGKTHASKRRLAADLYGDGTGVMGQLPANAVAVTAPASNRLVFTLSDESSARGHVGFFEFGDILVLRTAAGGTTALDTNLATEPVYWKVMSKNRKGNKVTLQGLDANLAPVATITTVSVQPAAGAVFYRYGQPTGGQSALDLTAPIADYGTITESLAGYESLLANDGRVIHGITMEGATAGTHLDAEEASLDVTMIQSVMSEVKVNVGQSAYKWNKLTMAPEAFDALVESRETDRRFVTIDDVARGAKKLVYQHQGDSLEFFTSEYCPKKRIYGIPDGKQDDHKVIEYHGSDYETVKVNDASAFNLKPSSSGGHERRVVTYMEALCTLIANHPASCAVIKGFRI